MVLSLNKPGIIRFNPLFVMSISAGKILFPWDNLEAVIFIVSRLVFCLLQYGNDYNPLDYFVGGSLQLVPLKLQTVSSHQPSIFTLLSLSAVSFGFIYFNSFTNPYVGIGVLPFGI